jgi:hypothetical protein
MTSEQPAPGASSVQALLGRLGEPGSTLHADEQGLLERCAATLLKQPDVQGFVETLGSFRDTLPADKRHFFDSVLLAVCTDSVPEVQAYAFSAVTIKHLVLTAVMALGAGAGTLAAPPSTISYAAALDQPLPGGHVGGALVGLALVERLRQLQDQLDRAGTSPEAQPLQHEIAQVRALIRDLANHSAHS